MSPQAVAARSQVNARRLIAQASADAAELTKAPDPATYEEIRGPLTECAALLEQIVRRLQPPDAPPKDSDE